MSHTDCENVILTIPKVGQLRMRQKSLIDLVKEQLLSISDAAKKLNVSEIEFKRLMEQQ